MANTYFADSGKYAGLFVRKLKQTISLLSFFEMSSGNKIDFKLYPYFGGDLCER